MREIEQIEYIKGAYVIWGLIPARTNCTRARRVIGVKENRDEMHADPKESVIR